MSSENLFVLDDDEEKITWIDSVASEMFQAPELKDREATYRSLQWSLGRVLLEMIATKEIMP